MSLITTAVPSGLITGDWCIQDSIGWHNEPNTCANSTLGQTNADFETICCNGDIINVARNLYSWPRPKNESKAIDLADMVCCGVHGPQVGGIGPIVNLATACTMGDPTPLASLAATNTDNAPLYAVTYTSASYGSTTTGDFVPTTAPRCLWMYTKTGVTLRNITVPAAQITSLPAWASVGFGDDSGSYTTSASEDASTSFSATDDSEASTTATSTPSTSSSGSSRRGYGSFVSLAIALCAFAFAFAA
ncbi:hypothetical protein LTR42_001709 [Elasticomyces elasticus]|nr:hypothetical protein LTR42_001709 [Elasticomyces elasticus]